jgi:3',5'-cyclic AMP phosphodiesterase CpdA
MYNEPQKPNTIRFVHISDTHNQTDNLKLPNGDCLLHTGDFTRAGSKKEVIKFNQWLGKVKSQFKYIVLICGNHV